MITGIFILSSGALACSNAVEMQFNGGKDIHAMLCFLATGNLHRHDEVECLIKYYNAPSMNFKGFIHSINASNDITVRMLTELREEGSDQIISRIASLI